MIQKLNLSALAILLAGSCLADDISALKIRKNDGENTLALSELRSIKYTDSDMVLNMKDGSQQVFALDDIVVMELGQISMAIKNICFDKNDAYVITDLQGKVVSKGNCAELSLPILKGIYTLSVGNKSKIIVVK